MSTNYEERCKKERELSKNQPKEKEPLPPNINIDVSPYDQNTYLGRVIHCALLTCPLNLFASNRELERSCCVVKLYKAGEKLPPCIDEVQLWDMKYLHDSSYHRVTNERINIFARMCAQIPMNMFIIGAMMTYYKSTPGVVFWQWFYQSYIAFAHMKNTGDGSLKDPSPDVISSYLLGTFTAVGTALALNKLIKPCGVAGRMVPLAAIVAANCVQIPLLRRQQLTEGIEVIDYKGNALGNSTAAARKGVAQIWTSKTLALLPAMVITPFIMNHLERRGTICRYPWLNAPLHMACVGLLLLFSTPLSCGIYKQMQIMKVEKLENDLREEIHEKHPKIEEVLFNKELL